MPRVVAVTVGSEVEFPNDDPIYHNVFSLSRAKNFNLGRYPQGRHAARALRSPRRRQGVLRDPLAHERHGDGVRPSVVRRARRGWPLRAAGRARRAIGRSPPGMSGSATPRCACASSRAVLPPQTSSFPFPNSETAASSGRPDADGDLRHRRDHSVGGVHRADGRRARPRSRVGSREAERRRRRCSPRSKRAGSRNSWPRLPPSPKTRR